MDKINFCNFCLARDDLLRITEEKKSTINSLLNVELPKDTVNRICINCTNGLTFLEKFNNNSRAAQKILQEQKTSLQDQNHFLDVSPETQNKLSAGFDNILEWTSDVNLVLRQITMTKGSKATDTEPDKENTNVNAENLIEEVPICEVHCADDFLKEEDQNTTDNFDELAESSSDESEEPTIEFFDENSVMQKESQTEKPSEENNNKNKAVNLEKYRIKVNGKRYYKCLKCEKNKIYDARSKLIYHLNSHKGKKPYKCIVEGCRNAYISPHYAVQHCRESHTLKVSASKWTTNEVSSDESNEPMDINYNDRNRRNKQRRYKCSDCNFTHTSLQALKYHLNIHRGLKPFKCIAPGCSNKYTSPYIAAQHCKIDHKLKVGASEWTGID